GEQDNLWPRGDLAAFGRHKRLLDDWLERVFYQRDRVGNQAMRKLADVLLAAPPSPEHLADGTLDDGAIEIVGFDVEPDATVAGKPVEVAVYFRVVRRPSAAFKLQVEARPARPPAGAPRVASSA